MPVEIHRLGLALLPALVQLRLDPVDLLPVVLGLDTRHAQADSRPDGSAGGVGGRLLPQEGLAPDVLVLDDAVPARGHAAGGVESRGIEQGEDLDRQLHGQPRDEVDLDDGRFVAGEIGIHVHIRVDLVAGDVCLHLGAGEGDPDAALVVVQRILRQPSRAREMVLHEVVAMQPVARDRGGLPRRGARLPRDDGRLLARAGHGQRRGFDGVVLEHALAVPRVEHPRVAEAGRLPEPAPGQVRGGRARGLVRCAREQGPRGPAIAIERRRRGDRGPPLDEALDPLLERDGRPSQHPLEVAVMLGRGGSEMGVAFVAAGALALALLEEQAVVSRLGVGLEERRLGALPPGERHAHASESRRRRECGVELALRRRSDRDGGRGVGKHGFLSGSPVLHLDDSARGGVGVGVRGGRPVVGPGGLRCVHRRVRGRRAEGSHGRICSVGSETANVERRCHSLAARDYSCCFGSPWLVSVGVPWPLFGRCSSAAASLGRPVAWQRGFGQLPRVFAAETGTVRDGQHWRRWAPAASNGSAQGGGRAVGTGEREIGERETGAATGTGTGRVGAANGSPQAASQDTRAGFAHNKKQNNTWCVGDEDGVGDADGAGGREKKGRGRNTSLRQQRESNTAVGE